MTWANVSDTSEFWTEVLDNNEVPLWDESSNEMVDDSGNVLIFGVTLPWSDAAANAETWVDV